MAFVEWVITIDENDEQILEALCAEYPYLSKEEILAIALKYFQYEMSRIEKSMELCVEANHTITARNNKNVATSDPAD